MSYRYLTPEQHLERIWSRVTKTDTCWLWNTVNMYGYGTVTYKSKYWLAHRLIYTLTKGEIPDGKQLDHLCRNRQCVNPEHLEPVTNRENVIRGNVSRGVCQNGHPKLPELQARWKSKGSTISVCKVCRYLREGRDVEKLFEKAGVRVLV